MEPQTPQTNTAGTTPANGLDPQALALTKAIGQTEGGNFTAKGKSGEYGAYQYLPSTWAAESQAAGVNVPLDQSTPAQQNEVAYKYVESLKQQGYNPGQIASIWNAGSGEPNAYTGEFSNGQPSKGVNPEGVPYNVQGYADTVMANYGKLNQTSSQPSSTGGGNPLVSSAEAAGSAPSGGSSASSGQPAWLTALEGLGIAGVGWLGANAAKPIEDAATGAVAGGVAGSILPGAGTIAGAVTGGAGGLAEGIIQDITGAGGSSTPPASGATDTSGSSSQPAATPTPDTSVGESALASSLVQKAINTTMQGTQSNRVYAQSQPGQDAISTAAQYNLIHPDEQGNLQFDEEKLKSLEADIERGKDSVIGSQGDSMNSTSAVTGHAGSFIGKDKMNTAADRQKAEKIVQDEIGADSGGKEQMSLQSMRDAQKTHYKAAQASYTNPKPNAEMLAHKALGHAYGQAIREKISDEDKPLFDKLSKTSRDLTNAKQLKKRIVGKKAPQNKGLWESFLRQGARAAEIYIGDKLGGPIGAIIGGLAGEHLNNKITKKFGKNIFETKGMKAALDMLADTKPKEYQELITKLKQRGIEIAKNKKPTGKEGLVKDINKDMLALPAGTIRLPARNSDDSRGIVTRSKESPKDFATAEAMQHGKPQFGGIYQKTEALKLAKQAAYGIGRRKGRPKRPAQVPEKYRRQQVEY